MSLSGRLPTAALLAALLSSTAGTSAAYEPQTTLAGVTQQAALSSRLHRRLLDQQGKALGLFEPLSLDFSGIPKDQAYDLRTRLAQLDPAEGYAPVEGKQTALGWLQSGAVLESVPSWRIANHFLDARQGRSPRGLHRPANLSSAGASLRAIREGVSTVRQLLTGTAYDGSGLAATTWITTPANEFSLGAFRKALATSVLGETPQVRDTALIQSLLCAGAIVSLLGQMGDPGHVRNDQSILLDLGAPSRGEYARYVAQRYGRAGVPAALPSGEALSSSRLLDLFYDGKGGGLAEATAKRFRTASEMRREMTQAELAQRAAVLLPETVRYGQRALDLLFFGELHLQLQKEGEPTLVVTSVASALPEGTLSLLVEGEDGRRKVLSTEKVTKQEEKGAAVSLKLPASATYEGGARRLVVVYRGVDAQGEPLLIPAQLALTQ